jgi:hypothetical protein
MPWRCLLMCLIVAAPVLAQTPRDSEWASDEALLREQKLPSKGKGLVQILRDRTPSPEVIRQFQNHVTHLSAAQYADRLHATDELRKMGPVVRPLLQNVLRETKAELETVRRLKHVLEQFPDDKDFATMAAAARLMQRDRPEGSLPVLLAFVPFATDELVRQEVQKAINLVGMTDKKPAKELLAALKSPEAAQRAAAGEALVRGLGASAKELIDPLLKDDHSLIRYQVGNALVEKHDKAGLPLLIQSIANSPSQRVEFALETLYRVAGEQAPIESYAGPESAKKFTAAWMNWHDKHHAKLDLAKQFARKEIGYTLITTMALKAKDKNRIFEIGPGPKHAVRWEFEGPRYPIDVQILGPNRMLLAEYFDRRVTERDFKGNILKQFPAINPIGCQRLPNGHTFIVTRQQLQIVDRDGQSVFTWAAQPPTISAAQRLRNGQMAVISSGGVCQLLDPTGKELKRIQVGNIYSLGGNIEVLPNGRILVALYSQNVIAEFDWTGKMLWQAPVERPVSVTRLANGHTLVTTSINYRVVELDVDGDEVWSYPTDGRPFRARRR